MKTFKLKNLDEILNDFAGVPIAVSNVLGVCPNCKFVSEEKNHWTVADALVNMLTKEKREGVDALALYDTGMRLYKANGVMTLQEHPFELLESVIKEAPYSISITVPVRRCLEDARKDQEEEEISKATADALEERLDNGDPRRPRKKPANQPA